MYAAAGANNLNGGSGVGGSHGRRQVMSSMDFYRRVPKDLTEVRDTNGRCGVVAFGWLRCLCFAGDNQYKVEALVSL